MPVRVIFIPEIWLTVYPGADSDEEGSSPADGNREGEYSIYASVPSDESLYVNVNQVGTLSYHPNHATMSF